MMILVALSSAFAEVREMYSWRQNRVRRTADRTAISSRQMYGLLDRKSFYRRELYYSSASGNDAQKTTLNQGLAINYPTFPDQNTAYPPSIQAPAWSYDTNDREFAKNWTNPWRDLTSFRDSWLDQNVTRGADTDFLTSVRNTPRIPERTSIRSFRR